MEIKQLSRAFQKKIKDLDEVLLDKNRGYGVVTVNINGLTFGIPLRSNIRHKNAFITDKAQRNGVLCSRGLDYQKALLLSDAKQDLGGTYKLNDKNQLAIINDAEGKIKKQFERYVKEYVRGASKDNQHILKNYRFTTLVNYHRELGISAST